MGEGEGGGREGDEEGRKSREDDAVVGGVAGGLNKRCKLPNQSERWQRRQVEEEKERLLISTSNNTHTTQLTSNG